MCLCVYVKITPTLINHRRALISPAAAREALKYSSHKYSYKYHQHHVSAAKVVASGGRQAVAK